MSLFIRLHIVASFILSVIFKRIYNHISFLNDISLQLPLDRRTSWSKQAIAASEMQTEDWTWFSRSAVDKPADV